MTAQNTTIQRNHTSEKLGAPLMRSLKIFIGDFPSMEVAAEKIGISRYSLTNIIARGTAKTVTINKIKEAIKPVN